MVQNNNKYYDVVSSEYRELDIKSNFRIMSRNTRFEYLHALCERQKCFSLACCTRMCCFIDHNMFPVFYSREKDP